MAVTMTDSKENIMGTMSEGRLLLKMALPMIFSVLVSSLYNIVDSIFVGRLGSARRCEGRDDEEAANAFFTASVFLMIVLASLLWVLFALFHDAVFIFSARLRKSFRK